LVFRLRFDSAPTAMKDDSRIPGADPCRAISMQLPCERAVFLFFALSVSNFRADAYSRDLSMA
jgi:hypothetical protein